MEKQAAKKKVQLIKNLPTLPGMLEKVSRMVESRHHSAEDVGRMISQDQVLSAKLLRMANSAFFGFAREVSSVGQALVLLGFDVVKGLILSSSVFDMIQEKVAGLWEHSLGSALAARSIADYLKLEEPEELSLSGLIHDLGKVVISAKMPADYDEIAALVDSRGLSMFEAEQEVLGFTHADVGQWLGESWRLPEKLILPIRFHHQPDRAKDGLPSASVVHLANILVRGRGYGFGGDKWVPALDPTAWSTLAMTVDDLGQIVDSFEEKLLTLGDVSAA
ncbi:MAG: HDOD domain-containing protein [Proteobacteria bacterium]|nr:HDOD domain-containing protein [Pseudomonadota bacterium]